MSKYEPLERYLKIAGKPRLSITFAQIEKILGSPLPSSARRYPAWWSNNEGSHVQAQAWLQSGYHTEQVDIAGQKLIFAADSSVPRELPAAGGAKQNSMTSIFGSMKGTTFVMPGVDLTEPTAPEWGNGSDA